MSKQQMIELIRQRNRSASNEFLIKFDEQALRSYLQRLTTVHGHRGRTSIWVRDNSSSASMTRACA